MNYLTTYYKNLSEQLQEQVNYLIYQISLHENEDEEKDSDSLSGNLNKVIQAAKNSQADEEVKGHGYSNIPGSPYLRKTIDQEGNVNITNAPPRWVDSIHDFNETQRRGGYFDSLGYTGRDMRVARDTIERGKFEYSGSDTEMGEPDLNSYLSNVINKAKGTAAKNPTRPFPLKESDRSESNRIELERINNDRRQDGKPPFKTLNAALDELERLEREENRKKAKKLGRG